MSLPINGDMDGATNPDDILSLMKDLNQVRIQCNLSLILVGLSADNIDP